MLARAVVGLCLLLRSDALLLDGSLRPAAAGRCGAPLMMGKKSTGSKLVTVLLDADVEGLGEKGTLVQVKPAYAENVILSKGVGTIPSKETLVQIAKEAEAAAAAAAAEKKRAQDMRDQLMGKFGKGLVTEVQIGPDGALVESLTSEQIALELKQRGGVTVEPSNIVMPEVTELGAFTADVTLHPDVSVGIKVVVEKSKITFT